jgi:hypothetical protein
MDETRDWWDIVATIRVRERVIFETPVTRQEALEMYENGEYQDISDQEYLDVIKAEKTL